MPGRRLNVDGQCVVVWDNREDFCAEPVTYAADVYLGERAVRLGGYIERVPPNPHPQGMLGTGATFRGVAPGDNRHYNDMRDAARHLLRVSRERIAEADHA